MEDEFRASESELSISVTVGKSKRIASSITLLLTPLSMDEMVSSLSANAMSNISHTVKCAWECSVDPLLGELANGPRSYCYVIHVNINLHSSK